MTEEKAVTRDDARRIFIPGEPGQAGAFYTESDNRLDCDIRPETHVTDLDVMEGQ